MKDPVFFCCSGIQLAHAFAIDNADFESRQIFADVFFSIPENSHSQERQDIRNKCYCAESVSAYSIGA